MRLGIAQQVGQFNFSDSPYFKYAVRANYSLDLNGDGVDELVFAGLETQPNSPQAYDNTNVVIYGWSNGVFRNVTSQWLPGNLAKVEGVGDITSGDFNGDGLIDLYLSANADMDHDVNSYQLLNTGSSFDRISLGLSQWEHGAAAGDLNQDGYDDVVVFGYLSNVPLLLGGPDGLSKGFASRNWPHTDSFATNGSGGAIGDFYGDGSVSVITVDNGTVAVADTLLFRTYINESGAAEGFGNPVTLPAPALGADSHDIRARALDFNHDGLLDVLVFSRESWDGTKWPTNSRVQFLQNNGGGNFIDVTDEKLVGYDRSTNSSYAPVIRDFNKDGLIDIFLSDASFESDGGLGNRSTTLLMQQSNGTFLDTGRDQFSQYVSNNGAMAGIVQGPGGQYYVVFEDQAEGGLATLQMSTLSFPEREQSETLTGTALADSIHGLGGNDEIQGLGGDDWVDGGSGTDIAVIGGRVTDMTGMRLFADNRISLAGPDGKDTLINIERVRFDDGEFDLYDLRSHIDPDMTFSMIREGVATSVEPTFFTGLQALNLHYQLIDTTPDAVVIGSELNDFIALQGGGVKAVDAGLGADVVDGGTGSTFVTGSGGGNTFFLDGRAEGVSWSTITDFELGQDKATIWGWKEGVSRVKSIESSGGAEGYQGVTFHFENLLPDDAVNGATNSSINSLTFTDLSLADFGVTSVDQLNAQILAATAEFFDVGQTVDAYGTHGYLYIA